MRAEKNYEYFEVFVLCKISATTGLTSVFNLSKNSSLARINKEKNVIFSFFFTQY